MERLAPVRVASRDIAHCGVPIPALLPSASVYDSRTVVPLSLMSVQRLKGAVKVMSHLSRAVVPLSLMSVQRLKGAVKVMSHLVFGALALSADQLMRSRR